MVLNSQNQPMTKIRTLDVLSLLYMMFSEVGEVHELVLNHPKIQSLLNGPNPPHYDVTFVSPLFNEMGLYFGQKFGSSVILYMAPVTRCPFCLYLT